MPNNIKTRLRTSILLLMFTGGVSVLYATEGNSANLSIPDSSGKILHSYSDTTQIAPAVTAPILIIPDELTDKNIDFQVNSEIVYLNIRHFRNDEAKRTFLLAWQKEHKSKKIGDLADSLRKVYAGSVEDKKDDISKKILASEQELMDLNNEIPELYEKTRQLENKFWGNASKEEIAKFQNTIKVYRDSIQQKKMQSNQTSVIDKNQPDTIDFYPIEQKTVPKSENTKTIVYKIQIGAYKGKVPDSAAKLIKKLSVIRKIDNTKDEKGVMIYTTGSLKSYQEAITMLNQVKQEGVKNAQITAHQNGKKITVDEARKINNEL